MGYLHEQLYTKIVNSATIRLASGLVLSRNTEMPLFPHICIFLKMGPAWPSLFPDINLRTAVYNTNLCFVL